MTALFLALVLHQAVEPLPPTPVTPPPLIVPLGEPVRPPRVLRRPLVDPLPVPELPPVRFALLFAPFTLFGAALWVEGDLHLGSGFTTFLNVGGGPFGQLAGDAGVRHFVSQLPWQGFYVDFRGSVFSLPASGMVLAGPGVQLGYSWRLGRVALNIGIGFTTWFSLARQRAGARFLNTTTVDAEVIVFPGFTQPTTEGPAVNPTVRISFGPTF
ncbi:MAG: hypothetical protein U0228_00365 [Myxococcaceae bacterium]